MFDIKVGQDIFIVAKHLFTDYPVQEKYKVVKVSSRSFYAAPEGEEANPVNTKRFDRKTGLSKSNMAGIIYQAFSDEETYRQQIEEQE